MKKKLFWLASTFLLISRAVFAQSPHETPLTAHSMPSNSSWDNSLPGKWTYRSYLNRADIIVNADVDPAVQALSPIFGQVVLTAASSLL